jgi:dipeptidyl-peptidase-4
LTEQPPGWRLTLDAVARYPRPGANVPASLAFSPDARLLTYLFSERGDLTRDLWAFDVQTGERRILASAPDGGETDQNVSPEEALRRERQRLREGGITHYSWAKEADRLLVPINGQLYVTSSAGEPLRLLAPATEPADDARLSQDGQRVVFVRGRELWVVDVAGGAARQLTFDSTETVTNGLAEFIAQEEMGRREGFWISPDGGAVAYAQVDEGAIPAYPIVHQGGETWRVETHRYPFAGGPNARVRLGVLSLASGETTWLDLGSDPDVYLARVNWCPTGRLVVQVESRDQRRLTLRAYDVATGAASLLLEEEADPWINLHNDLRFVGKSADFLWSSERSGYRHLYLYDGDGRLVCQLTAGEWPVDSVVHLDEERRCVYFLAGRESPVERHLYRVSLDGGDPVRLTEEPGFHHATFAANGSYYAHVQESRSSPPSIEVRSADHLQRMSVHRAPALDDVLDQLVLPELVEVQASDGTTLHGALYRPRADLPAPTVVSVYGGPHAQMVTDTWALTVDLRAQYLASLGYAVFKLDNRGSARRGLRFEGAIHRRLGTIEVQDQVAGVRWLVERGVANPERIGVYGWSYGGYMTLMCLLASETPFKVGVAGAPVTDWDGYDTHYTERYMDLPANNPDGYRQASALTHVQHLAGRLLVVHGMLDENVHFRHTARLIAALESADRQFDLLAFPDERHMPRATQTLRYLETQVADCFAEQL